MEKSSRRIYAITAQKYGSPVADLAKAMLLALNMPLDDDIAWGVATTHARAFKLAVHDTLKNV